ncbi:MAG: 16S rRNA (guanine(966)-N(2))-methyltransferase RsmD [Methylotenera sp.]|uniref:16S rRNA (guanine(966)-N(2))-methyltransferase RsmD n=1 Tax=Methylotenera sp. TaxID=2051956 RepID=UPI002731EAB2|nr:16S rRNA (guanine(966)-N(2))-methyltransferase RsmD [Methylotenera sp.]MDP1522147.1 16S rRNA (guanine(966)-N(2))-methyltransferase RsmD [Methylotenera sp.]
MADKKLNTVRINAGEWRSRLIKFPDATGLRPTPERVRQTVFNWLGQDLSGQTCLDLFAGTGVMGFEALSRGAVAATLVEKSMPAYKAMLENKQLLKAENANVLHQDALQFLNTNKQKFNLIFLDPPYNEAWLPKVLPLLAEYLQNEGLVYVEAEYALESTQGNAQGWQVIKQSRAGNVFYHLLKSV